MRKRKYGLLVYFSENEMAALKRKAAESRLSCADFVRRAVENKEIKPAPPVDIPRLTMEIHRAGNNINQLLRKANSGYLAEEPLMEKVLKRLYQASDAVVNTYTMED